MNTLIFSDTHFTERFEPDRYNAIVPLIRQADRVIINGDLWDRYLTTFERFLSSDWSQLFPLLKKKETYYLFGNHDLPDDMDKRVYQFATWVGEQLQLTFGQKVFRFEHGQRVAPELDGYFPNFCWQFRHLYPIYDWIEHKKSFLTKPFQQTIIRKQNWLNQKLKSHVLEEFAGGCRDIFVFSHSHQQTADTRIGYFNPGAFRLGVGHWAWIEGDKISVHSAPYGERVIDD
ncbi:metallophosphoesterase [Candidatus Woesebacteria bacterium]|nr:metallophosphoesterase [Candidatus Woesebacteria bacterium]